jgi:hypothetical protein
VGNNMTCAINFNYSIAKTLYTSEKYFVSGIYLQIPCIKAMNNNNNNNNNNKH